jgi:hypothetical protein
VLLGEYRWETGFHLQGKVSLVQVHPYSVDLLYLTDTVPIARALANESRESLHFQKLAEVLAEENGVELSTVCLEPSSPLRLEVRGECMSQ